MSQPDPWWPLKFYDCKGTMEGEVFCARFDAGTVKGLVFDNRNLGIPSSPFYVVYWTADEAPADWGDPEGPRDARSLDDLLDVRAFLLHLAGVTPEVSDVPAP